jgi:hypothetical protein
MSSCTTCENHLEKHFPFLMIIILNCLNLSNCMAVDVTLVALHTVTHHCHLWADCLENVEALEQNFSYFDPDYPTSGLVYCNCFNCLTSKHPRSCSDGSATSQVKVPVEYLSICNILDGWLTFGSDTVEWVYRTFIPFQFGGYWWSITYEKRENNSTVGKVAGIRELRFPETQNCDCFMCKSVQNKVVKIRLSFC